MKKIITTVFATGVFAVFAKAQDATVFLPGNYDTAVLKKNYIRVWDATAPEKNANTLMTKNIQDVKQATQYFDGLGRPIQTVVKKGSMITGSSSVDLVTANVYDEFGREVRKYLPFAASNYGSNPNISDGNFKFNPFAQQQNFYSDNNTNSPIKGQGETYYYGKTELESSPVNRSLRNYAPGNSWVHDGKGIKIKYFTNTTTDSIRIWTVTNNAGTFGSYSTSTMYAANELYKTIAVDENDKQVIEFKNKRGNVILKKVQLTASADTGTGKNYTGWLCTYYIYDDLDLLRAVFQPKGVELLIANSWSTTALNGDILNEQCFRYEYDAKGRMIMKKVPGAGVVYMVYDARDRLVLTQDSLMRNGSPVKWLYTQYDVLNRPIVTGLWNNSNDFSYHADRADTSITYPNMSGQTIEELTNTFYDNYNWRSSYGNPLSSSRDNAEDSYLLTPSSSFPYPQASAQSPLLNNLVTGTRTKVLGTSTYLYTVSFYDTSGKAIQLQSTNLSGGTDVVTTQYSWHGQQLMLITKTQKANNPAAQTSIVLTKNTYDSLWRATKIEKKIKNTLVNSNNMPSVWTVIAENEFDALGQLKKKKIGRLKDASGNYTSAPLDSLAYDYNIRGWVLGANRGYIKDTTSTANWFGFDLGYDKTSFTVNGSSKSYSAAQYNGNIEGMLWKSTGDDQLRKYDFTYDAVNRFISADFNQLTNNSFSKSAGVDFSVSGLTYDANGNILTMYQKGLKLTTSPTIDSLQYNYITNTNKLLNVIDRKNDTTTRLGDFRTSTAYMIALSQNKTTAAIDYTYDANGNLTIDKNKDIGNILYNYLNLPDSIRITGKGTIKYTYDAAGNKLKKITRDSTVSPVKVTTTLYLIGNYVNDTLQFLPQEEGRVRFKVANSSLQYDYFLKDHLGNIRMVLTEEKDTSAYPVASLETAQLTTERLYYSKIDSGRVNKSTVSGYPADTYTNPNDFIQKLSGNGVKVGTGIVLKVMAGDKFSLRVSSWWNSGNTPGTPVNPLNDLLSALNGSVSAVSSGHVSTAELSSSGALSPGATSFLNSQSYNGSKPKAFVNWILFDERFAFVSNNSGFEQVGSNNTFTTHTNVCRQNKMDFSLETVL